MKIVFEHLDVFDVPLNQLVFTPQDGYTTQEGNIIYFHQPCTMCVVALEMRDGELYILDTDYKVGYYG